MQVVDCKQITQQSTYIWLQNWGTLKQCKEENRQENWWETETRISHGSEQTNWKVKSLKVFFFLFFVGVGGGGCDLYTEPKLLCNFLEWSNRTEKEKSKDASHFSATVFRHYMETIKEYIYQWKPNLTIRKE